MWLNIIFILIGVIFKVIPVNKNQVIGYKSPFALKNQNTWKAANGFISDCFISLGIITIIVYLIFKHSSSINDLFTLNLLLVAVSCAVSIIAAEIYLRVKFKSDGSYRK